MAGDAEKRTRFCSVGFGTAVINPDPGHPLVGYFNPRPNTGVLDDLRVKVMLIEADGALSGVISYDLCVLSGELMDVVRAALRKERYAFAEAIPLTATHTHTGPYVGGILREWGADQGYLARVAERTLAAVREAISDMAPAELRAGIVADNPYAFNRRYWMKSGRVVTNPGKLNPDIVKPEGPVHRGIGILSVCKQGRPAGVIANICNHCDTTGGDKVSADWPGHMERELQNRLGEPIPVITLIFPAGNINHLDVSSEDPQISVEEAQRIGRGYAEIIYGQLEKLDPIDPLPVKSATKTVTIGYRRITDEQLARARRVTAMKVDDADHDLTSEDLARGSRVVEKFFAEQLLAYAKDANDRGRDFDLAVLAFSDELAVLFLPGEPFTEIGRALVEASPFKRTFVCELSNGACGYVALKECFGRGGYETLPVRGGGPREDTAELLIAEGTKLLRAQA